MKYTEEEKQQYVRSWESTEMSRKQFSIVNSISYASFLSWTKEYPQPEGSFIKLEDKVGLGTKIILPNGVVIQTDQSLGVSLLKILINV